MRSYDPEDEYDVKDAEDIGAQEWQLDLLKLNPSYVFWGPHEDYMAVPGKGWNSHILCKTWDDFDIELDELNEVVNFYFHIHREGESCSSCDRTGYNPETKQIADAFYNFDGFASEKWSNKITPDECQVLLDKHRLKEFTHNFVVGHGWVEKKDEIPPIEEITATVNKGLHHDEINRSILVDARAEREGVYGLCDVCKGEGFYYFDHEEAQAAVTFWLIHPRKGASRGVEVKSIKQEQVPEVLGFLRKAHERNAQRFQKVLGA